MSCSSPKRSGMARVNEGSQFYPSPTRFIQKQNELPLLHSHTASPHFGWYSFLVPLSVGGWVGVGGLVKYWGDLPTRRRSLLVAAAGNRTRDQWVASSTSLITRLQAIPQQLSIPLLFIKLLSPTFTLKTIMFIFRYLLAYFSVNCMPVTCINDVTIKPDRY